VYGSAFIAAAILGVLVAGVIGFVVGDRGKGVDRAVASDSTPSEPMQRGALHLSLPAGWHVDKDPVPSGSVLAGLDVVAARIDGPRSPRLLAWLSIGEVNPQLLPLGRFDPKSLEQSPDPKTVEFPSGQTALRYDGLRLRDRAAPLRVYAAPTVRGVLTVACPAEYLPQPCDAIATTAFVTGGDPLPIDPDPSVGDSLRDTFARLARAVEMPSAALASARTSAEIRPPALKLAAAYHSAAMRVRGAETRLGNTTVTFSGVASNVSSAAASYEAVAAAAASGDRKAYERAATEIVDARQHLQRVLARLRRQGYDIQVQPS
jgi:hypothetical protein